MSKKRSRKKKTWVAPLIAIVIMAALTVGGYTYFMHLYSLSNYVADSADIAGSGTGAANAADLQTGTLSAAAAGTASVQASAGTDGTGVQTENTGAPIAAASVSEVSAQGTVVNAAEGNASEAAVTDTSALQASAADTAAAQTEVMSDVESMIDATGLTESAEEALLAQTSALTGVEIPENQGIYNLLLVGVDRRDASWSGNSDAMILLSINHNTKQIHMISFMRDLYANIEGHGVKKLNAACAYGGCQLLVQTIEDNYKVDIDNYVCVDFNSMAKCIDAIGGVDIEISETEVPVANGLIMDMCRTEGISYDEHLFTSSGSVHCDGYQAVGFARIRFVGNSDYERTERQREVISSLIDQAKQLDLTKINSLATTILPLITHNIDAQTLLSLITQIPEIAKYELIQSRVPYDDMYTTQGELLMPDMEATIAKLQEEIYG